MLNYKLAILAYSPGTICESGFGFGETAPAVLPICDTVLNRGDGVTEPAVLLTCDTLLVVGDEGFFVLLLLEVDFEVEDVAVDVAA